MNPRRPLKINSTKPEALQLSRPSQQSALMPADLAVMPTGNAWISKNLPGFNVMRASYRWSALGVFAFWLLIMICVASRDKSGRALWAVVLLAMVALNLPNMPKRWRGAIDARAMFQQIDRDLVADLRKRIRQDEIVAFLPWGNDFIANYLAPRVRFRTFNIGGDKNLSQAQTKWPSEMLALGGKFNAGRVSAAVKMLIAGTADVLVVPYFHMLWSPHLWPCVDETTATLTIEQKEEVRRIPGFVCPSQRKAELHSVVLALQASPYVYVRDDSNLFATVRLRPEFGVSGRR